MTNLRVYNLGHGGAMTGLLIAGYRKATSEATFLVFLLDCGQGVGGPGAAASQA